MLGFAAKPDLLTEPAVLALDGYALASTTPSA